MRACFSIVLPLTICVLALGIMRWHPVWAGVFGGTAMLLGLQLAKRVECNKNMNNLHPITLPDDPLSALEQVARHLRNVHIGPVWQAGFWRASDCTAGLRQLAAECDRISKIQDRKMHASKSKCEK